MAPEQIRCDGGIQATNKETVGDAGECSLQFALGEDGLELRLWLSVEPLASDDDSTLQDKMCRIARLLAVR